MPSLRILLVDDYPADRKLIRMSVGKAFPRASFDEVSTRSEFEQAIADQAYDLIITDYLMRAFDGLELIDIVNEQGLDIPIIMVTGTGNEAIAIEAMHRGAADYVIKQKEHIKRLPVTIKKALENHLARLQDEQNLIALRNSEARKSAVLNTAMDGIICVDGKGNITEFNPASEAMFEYVSNRVLGKNMAELLIPQALQRVSMFGFVSFSACAESLGCGKRFESDMLRKSGETMPVEVTLTSDHMDGDVLVTFSMRDLTETKLLEQQLLQAQKMQAIGTLVGGIAHDFNNMLAGITGNTHLAMIYCQDNDKAIQKIKNIEALSFRTAAIIKQLLTFARKGITRREDTDLSVFLQDVIRLQRSGVPENIAFIVNISEGIHVHADASQLQQLVMNMVGNAVDAVYSQDHPCITFQLDSLMPDNAFLKRFPELQAETYAHMQISDNGCGIDASIIENIFDPFFTTKEVGRGTGLGLAMAYGAIKSNEGEVDVESQLGTGTTFNIYLPMIKDAKVIEAIKDDTNFSLGHGEVILLVDDHAVVLETGKAVLERLGYRVLIACNGLEAVDLFRRHQQQADLIQIDLIILDVIMPELGGIEAAHQIHQLDDQAKIIFATGYDSSSMLNQGDIDSAAIVHKPYRIGDLSRIIQQRLAD